MSISDILTKWFSKKGKDKPSTNIDVGLLGAEYPEHLRKIHELRVIDEMPLNEALADTGWSLYTIFANDDFSHTDLATKQRVLDIMTTHSEYKYCRSTKETIYRHLAGCDWLKGKPRIELIEMLFRHFEIEEMAFNNLDIETKTEAQSASPYEETNETRWVIGLAISCLINPRLVSHKKYKEKLSSLLHNKKYNKGRSELIIPYARIAKEEAIPELIKFLDERDLLHNAIFELGKLRAVEAKPHLEKIVREQEAFFRNLAKAALKKIP